MIIGLFAGYAFGLFFAGAMAQSKLLADILVPYVQALNNVPRVALIPLFILTLGFGPEPKIMTASLLVFFIVFFNAYEGATTIETEVVFTNRLLGASDFDIIRRVRIPNMMAWSFAALPNAVSLALLGTVTTEVFGGNTGIGVLLEYSLVNLDTPLTFALIILLAILGLALIASANVIGKRFLHWLPKYQKAR